MRTMHSVVGWMVLVACVFSLCSGSRIIGYWGAYPGSIQSTIPQLQEAVTKGYNVIIYAFYDVDANGKLTQNPFAEPAPIKSSIDGTFEYLVSLFGGNGVGPTLTLTPDAWAQAMYNNFVTLHNSHGFDGIDIDLENEWGGTGDLLICGLRSFFKLMHSAGYIVSMAPQTTAVWPGVGYGTGSWNSYAPLCDSSIIDYVDIVAVQLYNNHVPNNDIPGYATSFENGFQITGYPTCSGTVTGLVKVPGCKIAFGFPASLGAAPAGCPGQQFGNDGCPYGDTLANLYSNSAALKGTSGLMTWSIEYDQQTNWQFVTAAKSIAFSGSSCTSSTSKTSMSANSASSTTKSSSSTTSSKSTTTSTSSKSSSTSSKSTSTSLATTGQSTTGQPTYSSGTRLIGHWGANPGDKTSSLTQLQTALTKGYNVIVYAFYAVDANGVLTADSDSFTAPTKNTISTKTFTYLASLFGGQSGGAAPTITLSADAWAQAMYNNFVTLHNSLGFDGVDIDLGTSWGGTTDKLICGLRTFIKLMHNNGYTVSLAPSTLALEPEYASYGAASLNAYAPLVDSGIIDYVDIVAVQMYNHNMPYGDPSKYSSTLVTGFSVAGCPNCTGVTGKVKIPACKLAYGWPAAKSASASGCPGLPYSDDKCPYGSSLTSLYEGSSSLMSTSGLTTWSIEWDESTNWQFITAASSLKFSSCSQTTSGQSTNGQSTNSQTTNSQSTTSTSSKDGQDIDKIKGSGEKMLPSLGFVFFSWLALYI